jgi:hypothetical protein
MRRRMPTSGRACRTSSTSSSARSQANVKKSPLEKIETKNPLSTE